MCLVKTHKFPKISFRPIIVYKVLIKSKGVLTTPYQEEVVRLGETMKACKMWNLAISNKYIRGEGVHAFVDLEHAKQECFLYGRIFITKIPAFTFYWEGFFGDIAAKRMKIIKEYKSE